MSKVHPYFTTSEDAESFVVEAVELAAHNTPIPSLVKGQFNYTLGAPVNKKR